MKPSAGQLIRALSGIDDQLASKNGEIRQLKLEREAVVEQLELLMDEQETTMLAAEGLVCEAKYDDLPRIVDWDALERYVLRHKRLDLFQRRVSNPAWRSLQEELGAAVPGIEVFKARKLSVRKKGKT